MIVPRKTYRKSERLKSRKIIKGLFASRTSFNIYPLKVLYTFDADGVHLQAGVAVSTRNFRRATDRNRVKRLVRETYRQNKGDLLDQLEQANRKLRIFFVYLGKEKPEFAALNDSMVGALKKLSDIAAQQP